jgi:hypothetical protein
MTCLLNTFGKIGNLENIIQYLQHKDNNIRLEDTNYKNDDEEDDDDSKFKELENNKEG